jgi:hypothetical protein
MSLKKRLRTICVCLVLEAGVLIGVPVRMEEVQELLHSLNQPKVAKTDPEQDEQADD